MGDVWFYIFPIIAITFGAPIWLAVQKKRGIVFFTSQAATLVGLLTGIGLINNQVFGPVDIPSGALILTLTGLAGFLLSAWWYRARS